MAYSRLYTLAFNLSAWRGAASIENLAELHELDLSHNRLSGNLRIPTSPQLHSVDLSANRLEGTVPERSLSYASHLTRVNLSQNRLTGPIDSFVFGLADPAHCAELNLASNHFDGEIPSRLAIFQRAKITL
jgi:Ran GTPase-activating protein (RanGAP) involved in mRNA processing and transport